MPIIPQSGPMGQTTGLITPIGLPGSGFGDAAETLSRASAAISAVEDARKNAQNQIDLNQKLISFTKGMGDLQLQADNTVDPAAMRQTWHDGSQQLFENTSASIEDPAVRDEFNKRASGFVEQQRINIEHRAMDLTQSAVRGTTDERVLQLQQLAAGAKSETERRSYLNQINETLDGAFSTGAYKPEELAIEKRKAVAGVEAADITQVMSAIRSASSGSEIVALSTYAGQVIDRSSQLTPEARAQAHLSVEINKQAQLDHLEVQAKRGEALASKAAYRYWLPRIMTPGIQQPDSNLIFGDHRLDPTEQAQLVRMSQEYSKGNDPNRSDPRTEISIYDAVANPGNPHPITDERQLYVFLGHGASIQFIDQMKALLAANDKPGVKAQNATLAEAMRGWHRMITGASDLVPALPEKEAKYLQFYLHAQSRWNEVIANGKNPVTELLDPNKKDSLVNDVKPYQMTDDEYMDMMTKIGSQLAVPGQPQAAPPIGFEPSGAPKAYPPRNQGETKEEYLHRVGL